MSLTIHDQPLPYVAHLPERTASAVELVVLHCTELPDLATAREYGEKPLYDNGIGNSGHYYIDRDGAVYRYVP
ncbi:MAG TPA: N-acetylmuramoyl-L-alanine amidase, partial [Rhodanobacter sp.]